MSRKDRSIEKRGARCGQDRPVPRTVNVRTAKKASHGRPLVPHVLSLDGSKRCPGSRRLEKAMPLGNLKQQTLGLVIRTRQRESSLRGHLLCEGGGAKLRTEERRPFEVTRAGLESLPVHAHPTTAPFNCNAKCGCRTQATSAQPSLKRAEGAICGVYEFGDDRARASKRQAVRCHADAPRQGKRVGGLASG
eukprot:3858536-Pleurochrysis_carterae.AAC.2